MGTPVAEMTAKSPQAQTPLSTSRATTCSAAGPQMSCAAPTPLLRKLWASSRRHRCAHDTRLRDGLCPVSRPQRPSPPFPFPFPFSLPCPHSPPTLVTCSPSSPVMCFVLLTLMPRPFSRTCWWQTWRVLRHLLCETAHNGRVGSSEDRVDTPAENPVEDQDDKRYVRGQGEGSRGESRG